MSNEHDGYIELFLKWKTGEDNSETKTWLQKNGLSMMPMKKGLLITADRHEIEKAFSVSLAEKKFPVELPIPSELQPFVASITIPTPRSYHS